MDQFPKLYIVKTLYCRPELRVTFMRPDFGMIHPFILDMENYPDEGNPIRVGLELRDMEDPGEFIRPANLLELAFFSIKFSFLYSLLGAVRGHDECLVNAGKEMRIPFTTPCAGCDHTGRISLSLVGPVRRLKGKYQLVVVEEMALDL